jgi:hypothetical protein
LTILLNVCRHAEKPEKVNNIILMGGLPSLRVQIESKDMDLQQLSLELLVAIATDTSKREMIHEAGFIPALLNIISLRNENIAFALYCLANVLKNWQVYTL